MVVTSVSAGMRSASPVGGRIRINKLNSICDLDRANIYTYCYQPCLVSKFGMIVKSLVFSSRYFKERYNRRTSFFFLKHPGTLGSHVRF